MIQEVTYLVNVILHCVFTFILVYAIIYEESIIVVIFLHMNILESLTALGLTEQEARVYLASWELGASEASAIAKKSGFQRTAAYPILKKLTQQGFVSIFYKGTKRQYRAQQPEKLARTFNSRVQSFEGIIPYLKSMEKQKTQVFGLQFIETRTELERFYKDIIQEYAGKEYYVIGSAPAWEGIEPEFFVSFRKERAKANIRTKLLLSAESRGVVSSDPKLLRTEKLLPAKYAFSSTIDIYPDKILIVSPKLSALAVVIAVPPMVDVFKSVFELLWDVLPENAS